MSELKYFQELLSDYLDQQSEVKEPQNLYQPITYLLGIGGKRLRPILTLMAADCFDSDANKALDAALAVEYFHNFTLMHDDIMDDAPLRRGQVTVHEKWNLNTGILSGDAMLIRSYRLLENYDDAKFIELTKLLSETAILVCEGQQYDIDFETQENVALADYLNMIRLKTAVLLGASLKMGAIVARASETDQRSIYDFGVNLGMAFQLQDDYLDAFGDPASFGKQIGGDIIENKKTFLYLKALELASEDDKILLKETYGSETLEADKKITMAKQIFESTGSVQHIKEAIERYTTQAFSVLQKLTIEVEKKEQLERFGQWLMNRNH